MFRLIMSDSYRYTAAEGAEAQYNIMLYGIRLIMDHRFITFSHYTCCILIQNYQTN